MSNIPKVIELFAGGGGLALGLEQAGFETIGLVEMDKNACKTLRYNRPSWNVLEEDITKLSEENLESVFSIPKYSLDLISGGAPCQAFSYAGKKLGLEDTRGTLFYHYAVFLKKLQPKMFLFENVKGLFSHDKGKTFKTILSVFSDCGYSVQYQVLKAIEFETPQRRERLIVVGIRRDLTDSLKFSFPQPVDKPVLTLGDALKDCPSSIGISYSERKRSFFDQIPPGGNIFSLPESVQMIYTHGKEGSTGTLRRLSWDKPVPTLLCSIQQNRTEFCHPVETRPLTVREAARCQTFPDDWSFQGGVYAQYKQIGNAVPVKLAYHIGKSLIQSLSEFV